MSQTPNVLWPRTNAATCSPAALARLGRILLVLTAVSLLTMPVTERVWTWDNLAEGGKDFELSMILVLSFFCLVLVLLKQGKQCIASMFASWRQIALIASQGGVVRSALAAALVSVSCESMPRPDLSMQNTPLQI